MSAVRRARVYPPNNPGKVVWSSTQAPFNGYAVFDLVIPHNWWYKYYPTKVSFKRAPDIRAPHRVVVDITDGNYPNSPVLPLTDEYDTIDAWYIVNFHDRSRGFVAGPTVPFRVLSENLVMDFSAITIPNNIAWPSNPFTYTILFVDRAHGSDKNEPNGPYQIGNYLYPWRTVHNLEWFNVSPDNKILIRENQHSPWVDITEQFPDFFQTIG